jgi:hypothetical protein
VAWGIELNTIGDWLAIIGGIIGMAMMAVIVIGYGYSLYVAPSQLWDLLLYFGIVVVFVALIALVGWIGELKRRAKAAKMWEEEAHRLRRLLDARIT